MFQKKYNDEGGTEETSRKAHIDVDGQDRVRCDLKEHQLDPTLAQNREVWRKATTEINPGQG